MTTGYFPPASKTYLAHSSFRATSVPGPGPEIKMDGKRVQCAYVLIWATDTATLL